MIQNKEGFYIVYTQTQIKNFTLLLKKQQWLKSLPFVAWTYMVHFIPLIY